MFSCLIVFIFIKRNKVSSYAFSQSLLPVCCDALVAFFLGISCLYGSKELVNPMKSEVYYWWRKCSLVCLLVESRTFYQRDRRQTSGGTERTRPAFFVSGMALWMGPSTTLVQTECIQRTNANNCDDATFVVEPPAELSHILWIQDLKKTVQYFGLRPAQLMIFSSISALLCLV